jgi:2-hydroxychromene-2-carboxylate isomerase
MREGGTDMTTTARILMTGLTFTITVFTAGRALAAQDGEPTIILHVVNHAGIAPEDLARAEDEATRIYAAAGVHTVWAAENEAAAVPGLHLRVILLRRDMARHMIRKARVANGVLGQAAGATGRAYIFTHRITEMGTQYGRDFVWVLGQVMAHEVGHLVLPIYAHSDRGIMRAGLILRSNTDRLFTTEQGAAIRSMVMASSDVTR